MSKRRKIGTNRTPVLSLQSAKGAVSDSLHRFRVDLVTLIPWDKYSHAEVYHRATASVAGNISYLLRTWKETRDYRRSPPNLYHFLWEIELKPLRALYEKHSGVPTMAPRPELVDCLRRRFGGEGFLLARRLEDEIVRFLTVRVQDKSKRIVEFDLPRDIVEHILSYVRYQEEFYGFGFSCRDANNIMLTSWRNLSVTQNTIDMIPRVVIRGSHHLTLNGVIETESLYPLFRAVNPLELRSLRITGDGIRMNISAKTLLQKMKGAVQDNDQPFIVLRELEIYSYTRSDYCHSVHNEITLVPASFVRLKDVAPNLRVVCGVHLMQCTGLAHLEKYECHGVPDNYFPNMETLPSLTHLTIVMERKIGCQYPTHVPPIVLSPHVTSVCFPNSSMVNYLSLTHVIEVTVMCISMDNVVQCISDMPTLRRLHVTLRRLHATLRLMLPRELKMESCTSVAMMYRKLDYLSITGECDGVYEVDNIQLEYTGSAVSLSMKCSVDCPEEARHLNYMFYNSCIARLFPLMIRAAPNDVHVETRARRCLEWPVPKESISEWPPLRYPKPIDGFTRKVLLNRNGGADNYIHWQNLNEEWRRNP